MKYCRFDVRKERSLLMKVIWFILLLQAAFQSKNTGVFVLRMNTPMFFDTQRNTQRLIRAYLRWFLFSCLKCTLTSFGLNWLDLQSDEVVKHKLNFTKCADFYCSDVNKNKKDFVEFKNILPTLILSLLMS
jgi:SNF family Na+-dependent transporter